MCPSRPASHSWKTLPAGGCDMPEVTSTALCRDVDRTTVAVAPSGEPLPVARGVGGREHLVGDGPLRVLVDLAPHREAADGEHGHRGGRDDDAPGAGEPPGGAGPASVRGGSSAALSSGRAVVRPVSVRLGGRQRTDGRDLGEHLGPERGRRRDLGQRRQLGRRGDEALDLGPAGRAAGEVALEPRPLDVVEGVDGIGAARARGCPRFTASPPACLVVG